MVSDFYCDLYVNYESEDLPDIVANILDVPQNGRLIVHRLLGVNVVKNKESPVGSMVDSDSAFLFYPHYLEIAPAVGADKDSCIQIVNDLILTLKSKCGDVVAMCDFEDRLPG